jgi:hypothetical protein
VVNRLIYDSKSPPNSYKVVRVWRGYLRDYDNPRLKRGRVVTKPSRETDRYSFLFGYSRGFLRKAFV